MSAAGGFPPNFPGGPGAVPGGVPGGAPAWPQQQPPQQQYVQPPQQQFAPPQAGFAPGPSPYPQAAPAGADFVLDIPADPTWQPIEFSDTLEHDGYYSARIVSEKVNKNDEGKISVIFTLDLTDPDVMGKKVARFFDDPRATKGDTWWKWRSLLLSIYGKIEAGQSALRYTPGMFHGATVYVKTGAYTDGRGTMRTGVESMVTRDAWEEAVKTNRHRWVAKVNAAQQPGVGALPGGTGGLPSGGGLPGSPSMGLPGSGGPMGGLPGAGVGMVPQPGNAPMQQAPMAAPPGFGAPPGAAPVPQNPFAQQAAPPPPNPFAANGIPQPSATSVVGSFPGAK